MAETIIIGDERMFEYLCFDCEQLRLSLDVTLQKCGNCGSARIKKGEPGTLSREMLKEDR